MLRRASSLALSLSLTLLPACASKSDGKPQPKAVPDAQVAAVAPDAATTVPEADPGAAPDVHGAKWQEGGDPDEPEMGGFKMFKEAWMYVDGNPIGVLREVEFPPMPVAWKDDVESQDFGPHDPGPHEKPFKAKRWRISDYLVAMGVNLAKIKAVVIHGGRGVVMIKGADFRKFKNDLRFDLTGNNNDKLRVFLPDGLPRYTSFDRYTAISVIIDKPMPTWDPETNDLLIDGQPVGGIPYRGAPLRGGIRLYLDNKLALVIKRNQLGADGKVEEGRWNVAKLLAAHGVKADQVAACDIVRGEDRFRMDNIDINSFDFTASESASGKILMGPDKIESNAIMLYSKGKVPPVWKRAPLEIWPDGSVKTEW